MGQSEADQAEREQNGERDLSGGGGGGSLARSSMCACVCVPARGALLTRRRATCLLYARAGLASGAPADKKSRHWPGNRSVIVCRGLLRGYFNSIGSRASASASASASTSRVRVRFASSCRRIVPARRLARLFVPCISWQQFVCLFICLFARTETTLLPASKGLAARLSSSAPSSWALKNVVQPASQQATGACAMRRQRSQLEPAKLKIGQDRSDGLEGNWQIPGAARWNAWASVSGRGGDLCKSPSSANLFYQLAQKIRTTSRRRFSVARLDACLVAFRSVRFRSVLFLPVLSCLVSSRRVASRVMGPVAQRSSDPACGPVRHTHSHQHPH